MSKANDRSGPKVRSVDPMQLSLVLGLGANPQDEWNESDLAGMLDHQLSAPLLFDLGKLRGGSALAGLLAGTSAPISSFRDLFLHPAPPLELILLAKEFAKDAAGSADGKLPAEISTLMYYTSIGVARLRCGKRITKMDDARLREGLRWAMSLMWVEAPFRNLLRQCLECLPQ